MNKVYFLLGSNIGKSEEQLRSAIIHIEKKVGKIVAASAIYQTEAWGKTDQPDFLNQVVIAETNLPAEETLSAILSIEEKMGRVRTEKNAPRIIDIDILFYNEAIIREPHFIVPHPEIQNRMFVLVPLNELSPDYIHPFLHKTIHQLLKECKDVLNVKKF